jgi:hypothetical protein
VRGRGRGRAKVRVRVKVGVRVRVRVRGRGRGKGRGRNRGRVDQREELVRRRVVEHDGPLRARAGLLAQGGRWAYHSKYSVA